MNDPSPAPTPPARLVAETHHRDLVIESLRAMGIEPSYDPADENGELGLTRMRVVRDGNDVGDVDGLLLELRRRIAAQFGGWVPALGKDRESPAAAMGGSRIPMALGVQPFGGSRVPMALGIQPFGGSRVPMALGVDPDSSASHPPGGHINPDGGSRIPMCHHPAIRFAAARVAALPIRIGVIDVRPPDTLDSDPPPSTRAGHSIFVQDLIHQMAPTADVRVKGVLSPADEANTTWDVAIAMVDLALNENVDILLMPLGGFTTDGQAPLLFTRAAARIREHTMIIAAAGNHVVQPGWVDGYGATSPAWPAALPDVIAVGGADLPASGEQLPWVDAVTSESSFVAAFPIGTFIQPDGVPATFEGLAKGTGTSFCAAYAAGAVAARMSEGLSAGAAWDALFEEAAGGSGPGGG